MKKKLFICLAICVVIIFAFIIYKAISKIDFLYELYLYNHIEYNGIAYYHTENQDTPSDYSGERLLIYLVDNSLRVRYKYPYYAEGFEGDEEHLYLFFQSAVYTRVDNINELADYVKEELGIK